MIVLHVLASGSSGNAAIVENTRTSECVAIDCGICKRDFVSRAEEAGISLADIKAILITHEHSDHTKGIGVVLREMERRGFAPKVFANPSTYAASSDLKDAHDRCASLNLSSLVAGDTLLLAGMLIKAFPTSHDAVSSFGFRFDDTTQGHEDSLAYMTDTGIVTSEAHEALRGVRTLALEMNHDIDMLMHGSYPYPIKKRIASELGHLSNDQAIEELKELSQTLDFMMLEEVIAMHISHENNTYDLVQECLEKFFCELGHSVRVQTSRRDMLVSSHSIAAV